MNLRDGGYMGEVSYLNCGVHVADSVKWRCVTRLEKYNGDFSAADIAAGLAIDALYEDRWDEGNLLVTVGATDLWTALTGGAITAYSNGNANIGVANGNGSVPTVAASDTNLADLTNRQLTAMNATFPSISTNTVTFQATYGTAVANFAWNEWGVFNGSNPPTSHMLNHKGQALGTKVNTATWQFTVTLSLS